jgi:hypothetical protein
VIPSVTESDIASLLWAWDQDGPLRIGTGNTITAQVHIIYLTRGGTKNDYIMYNIVCVSSVEY